MTLLVSLLVAHQLNTSYVEIVEQASTLRIAVDLDPHDTPFLFRIDRNQDGVLSESEIEASCELFYSFAFASLQLADTAARCAWNRAYDKHSWDAGQRLWHGEAQFDCPKLASLFTLYLAFVDSLPRGHRALVRVTSEGRLGSQTVLTRGDALIDARVVDPVAQTWRFIRMGSQHILDGLDHLAFIVALLLGVTRFRHAVIVLTAFTLAHSFTLALVWLHLLSLSPRLVEPLIALSVVCVGLENLRSHRSVELRTAMAFVFGLVHGLGFATALGDAHFAKHTLLLSLFAFNLGIELTQVALVLAAWPLAKRLGRGRVILSVLLVVLGLVWAVQRVL